MKLTKIQPYSDDKLIFNQDKYELAFEYVKSLFEVNFKDDAELHRRIVKNSRKIYNFIFYRIHSANKVIVETLLNHTEQGRKFLLDVLTEQFDADNESGYNDLSSVAPINVSNGQVIDRNLLYQNQISVDAEQIIDRNAEYFGINIMYQAPLPYLLGDLK